MSSHIQSIRNKGKRVLTAAEPEPEYSREANRRERRAVARDGWKAYERPDFQLLK
jgi:hypothetical protein